MFKRYTSFEMGVWPDSDKVKSGWSNVFSGFLVNMFLVNELSLSHYFFDDSVAPSIVYSFVMLCFIGWMFAIVIVRNVIVVSGIKMLEW